MASSRAIQITEFGLDKLRQIEVDIPQLAPGQIRIRMKAVSPNYRDLATIKGLAPKHKMPLIPFSDGVGEVVETGQGVTRFKVGDRVCPMFFPDWVYPSSPEVGATLGGTVDGVLQEYMVLGEHSAAAVPAHLTDAQAATLPCAALTAWSALVVSAGIKAGDTVLIEGTGGVSIFGLQFAKMVGAEVIITSGDDSKLARAKALGADHTINYRTCENWGEKALELTAGRGADIVLEVGGAGTVNQAMTAAAPGGRIALVGVLSGYTMNLVAPVIMGKRLSLTGVLVGNRQDFEAMCRAIHINTLVPCVDREFPLDERVAALEYMASGKHFGKIALSMF